MPANLYGVAQPNPLPVIGSIIGGTNVVIPGTNVETNFFTIPVPPATAPGWYYPNVWGVVVVSLTATPPSFVNWGARIGAGSDFSVQATGNALLVASGNLELTLFLPGASTFVSNPFGATNFFVSAAAGANSFTVMQIGTWLLGQWVRAPDQ